MKKLGFGLMRLPRMNPQDPASIDYDKLYPMVDLFLERGFTYFDTAWMYQAFESERSVKKALVERHPRDSFTITTKLHSSYFDSFEDRDKIFYGQLEKTGVEYFDYYLLHGIENPTYPKFEKYDCFNWMLEKKGQGLVKHVGFSFHGSPEMLDAILTKYPQMEYVQLQINYLDWESPWIKSRECYEVCVKHNKKIIVMEPVKGGTLAKIPGAAEKLFKEADPNKSIPSWAIRFAASLPNVALVLSGMSTLEQVDDNTSIMDPFVPLTEDENELCFKAADIINNQIAIPCTGCSYCTDGCPMQIAIPQYFSLYNEHAHDDMDEKGWTVAFNYYSTIAIDHGRASDCIECGQCEGICPQHLPIITYLKKVADALEEE